MKKIISSLLLLNCFIFCYGQSQGITDNMYPSPDLTIPYHSEWAKTYYPKRIAIFKNNPLQQGDIVFLGNSITEHIKNWDERFNVPTVKNRGIAGDVTEGVIRRLAEINYCKPKAVFLLIGINDLFQGKDSEFVANNILKIVEIIHKNSKSTKIYVHTILPTKNDFLVEKISAVNSILKKNKSHFKLIDLHKLFMDENDFIKKEYTVDGVHLNEEGYKIWINEVKDYVVAASKRKN